MTILKYILAFIFGAFGGFVIYLDLGLILFTVPPGWFVFVSLFGGWALTSYWVVKGTTMLSEMLSKSCLVGALLSFSLSPTILILTLKTLGTVGADSGAEAAGAFIGGGLASGLVITISLTFTFLFMVGYGLVKLFTRENRVGDSSMMECVFCSEPIRATAKKCRHCGEFLESSKAQKAQKTESVAHASID
jgi:hypothetical protein